MATLERVHTFANKTIVDGSEIDAEFDNIISHHAAGHTSDDMHASAGIGNAQLANSYEHLEIQFHITANDLDNSDPPIAGWPATTLVAAQLVCCVTGDTAWEATDIYWMCSDIGGSTGTFKVLWGTHAQITAGNGTDVAGATITINATQGSSTGLSQSLAVAATPQALGIYAVAADAAAIDGTEFDFLNVAVRLRRGIAAS